MPVLLIRHAPAGLRREWGGDDRCREDGLALGPRPQLAKGSVWVLSAEDGRFVDATYLAPPRGKRR